MTKSQPGRWLLIYMHVLSPGTVNSARLWVEGSERVGSELAYDLVYEVLESGGRKPTVSLCVYM